MRDWYDDDGYVAYCHAADLDGLTCGLLLADLTAIPADRIAFLDYPLPADLGAEGRVVVCDLNLPEESRAWENPHLRVFDHHGQAPAAVRAHFPWARDDGGACAAVLLGNALPLTRLGPQWPSYLLMVNAGDLHLTEDPEFTRARCYAWLLNKVGIDWLFAWARSHVGSFRELPADLLDGIDAAREQENQQAFQTAAHWARWAVGEGDLPDFMLTWLIGGDRSDVLTRVAEQYGGPAVGLCLDTVDEKGELQGAVRDPKGRAREIAQHFGGGGHRNAAGFP